MNFIETLKSVGGIKPCQPCSGVGVIMDGDPRPLPLGRCSSCHGTGQILDLAPLLARPKELEECVKGLVFPGDIFVSKQRVIVGPQHAQTLVYEIARQLEGMAVVAIEDFNWEVVDIVDSGYEDIVQQMNHRGEIYRIGRKRSGYRLSLPIPDDSTVLFVTDRLCKRELEWAGAVMDSPSMNKPDVPLYEFATYLGYVLCLVNSTGKDTAEVFFGPGHSKLKILSLYQEQP